MASSPTEAMIGTAGLGFGIVLMYAAFRNVPVFGKNGIITSAITTGKIPDVGSLPPLFQESVPVSGTVNATLAAAAVLAIEVKDKSLGGRIRAQLQLVKSNPIGKHQTIDGLLDEARKKGMSDSADIIQRYIDSIAIAPSSTTPGSKTVLV
jgi:hypothetical protein